MCIRDSSWAEPYVAACYTNGITSGMSATTYGGDQSVTTAQAALMLMKALGYFQYQSDFEDDWQFATIKQAGKIELFEDVDSGVTEAMTRNDLAQLVLNALESGTVSYTHLDVYKRQVMDPSLSPDRLVEELSRQKCAEVAAAHPDGLVIAADTVVSVGGLVPVSYTHLDVYKRQDRPGPAPPWLHPDDRPLFGRGKAVR